MDCSATFILFNCLSVYIQVCNFIKLDWMYSQDATWTWPSTAWFKCAILSPIGLTLPVANRFLADRTIGRAFGTMCRLSVCHLSVRRLSVTFCIVAKRYVLAKKCLKEWIGNQGQKIDFLGRCHISTSSFAATSTATAIFTLFLPVQPSNRY